MCGSNCITLEREETVSDKEAKVSIKRYLKELKKKGEKKVGIIELLSQFSYPAQQIERVMEKLEKERMVKEEWPPW